MKVVGLYFYPVKSCAGTSLETAAIDNRGIKYDRGWMVVNKDGMFLTQRQFPRMALIKPDVAEDGSLTLSAECMPDLLVQQTGETCRVKVWSDTCRATDQGDDAAQWLSAYLKIQCRLVKMADDYSRKVDSRYAVKKSDEVGFADGYPFLVTTTASLEELNRRLSEPLPMDRFRPNIVVDGCQPFAEDGWTQIQAGDMRFHVVKPCGRCPITTVNQLTAEKAAEPLQTLALFRKINGKLIFGQNLIHEKPGSLSIGDTVASS